MDIHAEKGMQCADCHFAQDSHGNGLIYGEVANAVEIGCKDCHGTADAYPTLLTSGPAAPPKGNNLALLRNPDGQRRFEWITDGGGRRMLIQRSIVDPKLRMAGQLVKDSVDPASPHFNAKAARAKLMSRAGAEDGKFAFGPGVADRRPRARRRQDGLLHLPPVAGPRAAAAATCRSRRTGRRRTHHYEGEETRNFATYNPQVARDDMFQLGRHMTTKGNQIAPVRSTSALVLSSTNVNRERIYVQQPPISAIGFSSQAFAPHFPHTVRTTETKTCTDCHLSAAGRQQRDHGAAAAARHQLRQLRRAERLDRAGRRVRGGARHRMGRAAGGDRLLSAALRLSRLLADACRAEQARAEELDARQDLRPRACRARPSRSRSSATSSRARPTGSAACSCAANICIVAEGRGGFRVYDVASIANKGVSERIVTAPFSPLGQNTHVATKNATCMALPTNQPIDPLRNTPELREMNQEQPFLPIYNYAVVTDTEEGLILVNVDTLADGEFRNNFLKRAVTWNPDGVLKGARHITLAGERRLYHRRCRAGRGRPRRSAAAHASPRCGR